jgi:hypothetical protein
MIGSTLETVRGRASPAKAAVGDKPVFAYIASLPQPQRGVAEGVDALAARKRPGLQRSVKCGISYYSVGDGCASAAAPSPATPSFMFVNGAALELVPPVTPVGNGQVYPGVELESLGDLDERQIAAWMKQVAEVPGAGGRSDEPEVGLVGEGSESTIDDRHRIDLDQIAENRVATPSSVATGL